MSPTQLQAIIEAALMVAGQPLAINQLSSLFTEEEGISIADIKSALKIISEKYNEDSGIELKEVASGHRLQAKAGMSPWISKLWAERAPRYSRAFMETIAIIAYKQPVTRAEIESIRGVTVSSHIVKTLMEREWVRIVGHKEIPGRPAIYGTTKTFLDYFNIKSLTELPTLAEFKAIEAQEVQVQLALENSQVGPINSEMIPEEREAILTQEMTEEDEFEEYHTEDEEHEKHTHKENHTEKTHVSTERFETEPT